MSSYLQKLEILPPEIIADFRKTKESVAIPEELQKYILHLEAVVEIRETEKFTNITTLARLLRKRYPDLPVRTAKQRVYDALSFFHVNETVANEVWDQIYADKLEDLAKYCIKTNRVDIAYKSLLRAHDLRTKSENRIKLEDLKPPTYIISNKIKPEDLGYEKENLREIQRKASDGHYVKLIDSLAIDDEEKTQLKLDADITDAEIIDDNDE